MSTTDTPASISLAGLFDRLGDLDLATLEEFEDRLDLGLEEAMARFDEYRASTVAFKEWHEGGGTGPRPTIASTGKITRGFAFLAGRLDDPGFTWADAGAIKVTDLDKADDDAAPVEDVEDRPTDAAD